MDRQERSLPAPGMAEATMKELLALRGIHVPYILLRELAPMVSDIIDQTRQLRAYVEQAQTKRKAGGSTSKA